MASSSSSSPAISTIRTARSSQPRSQGIPTEVLEDLSSRFILNLPDEELQSLERVCFQVEQAHWYYEDFIRDGQSNLPSYNLKTFSEIFFRWCPLLEPWSGDHESTWASFMEYKTRVPVCGAIMLNATWDKCVLVKGWKASSGWGFPKGKINEQEPRHRCAIREVLEETGYDLDGQLDISDYIELSIKEQKICLYIVPGVSEDYHFETKTRKEISEIKWFKLTDLPTWRYKPAPGKFYLIGPFIQPLKKFIRERRPRLPRRAMKAAAAQNNDVHASSEDDNAPLEVCAAINHDPSQESSSQSSVDNGDPQTPSPQYSEPPVNRTVDETVIYNPAEGSKPGILDLKNVEDPHLARILTSLSMSASTSSAFAESLSETSSLSTVTQRSLSPAVPTGAPAPSILRPDDWSMHGPGPASHRSPDVLSSQSSAHRVISPTVQPASHVAPPSSDTAPTRAEEHPSTSHRHQTSISQQFREPPNSVTQPLRSPVVRRQSGSRTDLSPYLSRGREVPINGKHMKYITMLDRVVYESERMTPKPELAGRSFASQLTPAGMAMGSSMPIPPQPAQFGRMESPVIYSSGPGASMMPSRTIAPLAQQPSLPFDTLIHDDPFTVRPRTSNAFLPVPYIPSSLSKMNEENVRFMTPTLAPRQPMSNYPGSYLQSMSPASQSFNGQYPASPQNNFYPRSQQPHIHPALRVVPPQMYPVPPLSERQPLSAPATSPAFNPIARNNNAHLLSILNASNTGTGMNMF